MTERVRRQKRKAAPIDPEVMDSHQVAAMLQVSRRSVERMGLPSFSIGRLRRYLRSAILDHLAKKSA